MADAYAPLKTRPAAGEPSARNRMAVRTLVQTVLDIMLISYSLVLMNLWALCIFLLSFGSIHPLFSSSYRLFLQKYRGGVCRLPKFRRRQPSEAA
jgi:hypothetical protein